MKFKIKLAIFGIIFLVVGTKLINSCTRSIVEEMNKSVGITIEENPTETIEETKRGLGWVTECNDNNVGNVVNALIKDSPYYWNSDLISENFKSKYKSAKDILMDIEDLIEIGASQINIEGRNLITISWFLKKYDTEEYGTIEQVTANYYDYAINDTKQLDDLQFLYNKIFSETIALTGERLDGKKEATDDEVKHLLHFIANPYHNFDSDFDYTTNYTEEAMPYSDTCKIVNRPDLTKLGIPDNSYTETDDENLYIIFEYPDKKIKYKVDYKVNWDLFFDYIEYIEVKE